MGVTFQGPPASGVNQARRRGRIFLPTYQTSSIIESGGRVVWEPNALVTLAGGFETFHDAVASAGGNWAVFSPTTFAQTAGTTLDRLRAATTYVTDGWIDDEPDTQRRRGSGAGVRTLWS